MEEERIMSNPAVCYLVRTQINGVYFAIEDNLGEAVHIHYADIRIDMTIEEFMRFSDCVISAAQELFNMRGLNWNIFDSESIKEEWVKNYKNISSVEDVDIELDSLYMKESFVKKRSIKRIIPLKESGYIPYYKGVSCDRAYYDEPGIFEPSRGEKARKIENEIQRFGYPYDEKRILIDQEGYILDGLKRASCLYYLFGGNYRIPAIRLNIEWNETLEMRREHAELAVKEYEEKNNEIQKNSNSDDINKIPFDDIVFELNKINAEYMVICGTQSEAFDAYAFILVKKEYYGLINSQLSNYRVQNSSLAEYYFAYALNLPLVYSTDRGMVVIHDKYFVKSKFIRSAMIPLDKVIQAWIWDNREYNMEHNLWEIKTWCKVVLIVIHSVLEGREIPQLCIESIKKNKQLLREDSFKRLLELVFFKYSQHLLDCLLKNDYDAAVSDYVQFAEY